ncbi:unnamed protein product [Linum trigynum]|uniref:Uncharacterized protein n=1 Tax=Linum trigynum TaxID=586398 RepID=A0AAV2E5A8_9ROSI
MKALYLLPFLCLLAAALYFSSHGFSSSSTNLVPLPSRRSMREWNIPTSTTQLYVYGNNKDLEQDEQENIKEHEELVENLNDSDSVDELIYHIDYNGVTTHPTPRDF